MKKRTLLVSLLLVGCQKSTAPGEIKRPDISEMSVHDALYTKYSKLQLVCGATLSAPGQPTTKRGPYVVWDILKFYAPEKTFLFRETVGDMTFSYEGRGKLSLVSSVDYSAGTKNVHAIDVARFDGVAIQQTITIAGQVTKARDNPPFTLTDSLPVPLTQSAAAALTCTLNSQVKPGFETDTSTP